MRHITQTLLARLDPDLRGEDRRHRLGEFTLSVFDAFDRNEREIWRRLDRRLVIRRAEDVRRRIAAQAPAE